MIAKFKQKLKTLNSKQRQFLQFVSLVGLSLCLIGLIYTIFANKNTPPSTPSVNPLIGKENSVVLTGETATVAPLNLPKNNGKIMENQECGSPTGGPRDNPIATQYGPHSYPWTDAIKWHCVYNIQDFPGATISQRLSAAIAAAAAGGVIYFPAGTYEFDDDIYLSNGIVLRGETPRVNNAKSDTYAPPTQFLFPQYQPRLSGNGTPNNTAFKKILTRNSDQDSNLGLVNLDINRAAISLVGNGETGANQNLIIFGIRSNNVAAPDPQVPDLSFQAPWMRFSDRFAANIKLQAKANILVANNRINDQPTDTYDQPGYIIQSRDQKSLIRLASGHQVPFSYTDHYGIVVNRSKSGGFQPAATPDKEPGLFRKGIVIRDNWVYHTMRVGIQASGDGLVIQDNQIKDQPQKQAWVNPTGLREPKGADTFENRAIDWSGWNVKIQGNQYEVYQHRIQDSQYFSTDGEGILIQECCGGTTVNGAEIKNNQGKGYIGLYKTQDIKNVLIQGNQLLHSPTNNTPLIYVVADTNHRPYSMQDVTVENNIVQGSILLQASAGGARNVVQNNQGSHQGAIAVSCHVHVTGNQGFEAKPCLL